MPEWDKRKAPWNASMGQVEQEQGSSSSGQQLLPATALRMEQATDAATAPDVISRLLLLQENMTCFSALSSPTLQSSPADEQKQQWHNKRLNEDQVHSSAVEKVMQLPMGTYASMIMHM